MTFASYRNNVTTHVVPRIGSIPLQKLQPEDLDTFCAQLLGEGQDGIHVKVVSERLGHANIAFTMQTYQHLPPGLQHEAARSTERLARPVPPTEGDSGESREKPRRKSA